ncbi:hypothetical protein X769_18575 [Mesorhizobium sp. LSJC268A00]|nr:hypothetical protein X773_19825 [Mesorhizobium sp. LSJC285A00]ESX02601.1 hypothetical protein X769_18575 [Mesorhizobium sp. LSJC268A00]ESX48443.1 hypothetical protein X762_15835 [Mesorhizobium sp. LSHC426A00]ESY00853.1 hypothetical protein X753_28365 [Mesorhizobium sp. LNJC399B00]ESZ04128.1 hypothetical protein X736_24435 [Mesorhizobium sp. L2C089B000]
MPAAIACGGAAPRGLARLLLGNQTAEVLLRLLQS